MSMTTVDVTEAALAGLQRNQSVLVITDGPARLGRQQLDELAEAAKAAGVPCRLQVSTGRLCLSRTDGPGRVDFMSARQAGSYGGLRGQNAHLVLHAGPALLPDILPCLLTVNGVAVDYTSGTVAGPGAAQ